MVGWQHVAADLLFVGLFASVTFLLAPTVGEPLPRVRRNKRRRLWASLVTLRLVTVVLCLFAMTTLGRFNSPGNPVRRLYLAARACWDGDSQARNYFQDGFVGGTLANFDVRAMRKPIDYNANTMHAIARRYESQARLLNSSRDPNALDGVNVVMILSESFADPTLLDGIEVPRDPIPFTHKLMAKTTSGNMLAQDVGGGTANMEFEALTGTSMSQFETGLTYPYSMLVAGKETSPHRLDSSPLSAIRRWQFTHTSRPFTAEIASIPPLDSRLSSMAPRCAFKNDSAATPTSPTGRPSVRSRIRSQPMTLR